MKRDIETAALKILSANRHTSGRYQYTVPSPDTYPYQWLWDSCFHSIVLSRFSPDDAKKELASLVAKQFDDGMLPHMLYWDRRTSRELNVDRIDWGRKDTSTITQPPILAFAVWEVHRRAPDMSFLASMYPALIRYYRYLVERRDPYDDHLVSIINPDESGEYNSPRFDAALGVPEDISIETHFHRRLELVDANRICNFDVELCTSRHFWVRDVPFNVFLVENLRIAGSIASLLGKRDDERFCTLNAKLVEEAMRTTMFDDGLFWSTMGPAHEKIRIATWAHFAPMFAGLYTLEEAEALLQIHLRNEETFRAPFGIRTVSKQESSYRPDGFWRGSVWFAPHWFVYKGLMRYGFKKEAEDIRAKSTALLERSGFREYFNPETGEGYGAHEFTWGALVLDMMEG